MLTGKQRGYLKSLANSMDTIMQIGKGGVTENVIKQIDDALEARELIKIKILNNSTLEAKETANAIAVSVRAEYVQSIGNKFVLYRKSEDVLINLPK
ncbi:MAG: ribosome assembly RNA-binding protein YhbY [Sedimentibacter sp.]